MALLGTIKVNLDKIDESKIFQGKKGRHIELTFACNDETDSYGNNVSAWNGQTKEERDSKEDKKFVGNGRVFWTDGNVVKAEQSTDEF